MVLLHDMQYGCEMLDIMLYMTSEIVDERSLLLVRLR
jgi:hypothetical protein